jgi:hypothetical protein
MGGKASFFWSFNMILSISTDIFNSLLLDVIDKTYCFRLRSITFFVMNCKSNINTTKILS